MRKQGEVLSRLELAEQVWDINFNNNTNVVEVAVRRLRGKVDDPLTRSCCTRCAAWATCWNCGKTDAAALRLPAPLALALAGDADVPGAGRVCLAVYYATNLNLQTRQEALLQQKMKSSATWSTRTPPPAIRPPCGTS